MKRYTFSIRVALILVVSLGTLMPSLIMTILNYQHAYRITRIERIQQRLDQYLELTTPIMSTSVWDVDKANVQTTVNGVMRDQAVVDVSVSTEAVSGWVHSFGKIAKGDETFSRSIPLTRGKQAIGTYNITISDHLIRAELVGNLVQQGTILLLQNLLSLGFILWLLHVRFLRPLLRLKEDTERLAVGGLDTPIIALQDDEIGVVALGLDKARRDLKFSFEKFESLNATLENRVSERTVELKSANDELRTVISQLDQARDELVENSKLSSLGALVAGVAHELNTPIGNALLLSSTLVDEHAEFAPKLQGGMTRTDLLNHEEKIRKASELIQANCARAADLVSSFKQVAVDSTGAMRRKGSLRQFVHEILTTLSPTIKQTTHTVVNEIDQDIQIDTYPGQLGQVIINLVNNALLHAFVDKPVGQMTIDAHVEGQVVILRFSDNGAGIPANIIQHIFDPFFTTKLGQGGSGLGLYIVRNIIISALGGKIRVESEMGIGTSFIISIALVAPERAAGVLRPHENMNAGLH